MHQGPMFMLYKYECSQTFALFVVRFRQKVKEVPNTMIKKVFLFGEHVWEKHFLDEDASSSNSRIFIFAKFVEMQSDELL
jgi:hypothetical protein